MVVNVLIQIKQSDLIPSKFTLGKKGNLRRNFKLGFLNVIVLQTVERTPSLSKREV